MLRLKSLDLELRDGGEMPGVAHEQREVVFQRSGGDQGISVCRPSIKGGDEMAPSETWGLSFNPFIFAGAKQKFNSRFQFYQAFGQVLELGLLCFNDLTLANNFVLQLDHGCQGTPYTLCNAHLCYLPGFGRFFFHCSYSPVTFFNKG